MSAAFVPPRRLVLIGEGKGETGALPVLVGKVLRGVGGVDALFVDPDVFRLPLGNISGRNANRWPRSLEAACKRSRVGAVLLVSDGDVSFEGKPLCPVAAARTLADRARPAGAGATFSLACVFAVREYEAWLAAGAESLAGRKLPDGRDGLRADARPPDDAEAKRDMKDWLSKHMSRRYKPTVDQRPLTELLDLAAVRQSGPRSFRRLENAVRELVAAARRNRHVATPTTP